MASKKLTLEDHAAQIREELKVPNQSALFECAVEAGYLAALADGNVDAEERSTLAKAVELLSQGAVIEWETENLLDSCASRAQKEGAEARATAVGKKLEELGQAEVGMLIAAVVARATNGVEKAEADVLKSIGKAAGLSTDKVRNIVKRAVSVAGGTGAGAD
jgi:tellurite resistance protein